MEEDETGGRESNHPFIGTPHTLCSSGSRRRRKTEVGSAVTQRHVSINYSVPRFHFTNGPLADTLHCMHSWMVVYHQILGNRSLPVLPATTMIAKALLAHLSPFSRHVLSHQRNKPRPRSTNAKPVIR
jgi:hypothetical protein